MRVGLISSFDVSGGAGRAAYRLHQGLRKIGVQSTMFAGSKVSRDVHVQLIPPGKSVPAKLRRRLRYGFTQKVIDAHAGSIANGHDVFSSDRIPGATEVAGYLKHCDIIHLHWVSWFVDWEDFFSQIPTDVPIVWTLHDMNTFTGGCHYDAGCGRYRERCGQCPALDSTSQSDLSSQIFERKAKLLAKLSKSRFHFVAPSQWLLDAARGGTLLKPFESSLIPYGLDLSIYQPIDQQACRTVFHIPLNAKVVLFVADSNENKRKGFALLVQALAILSDMDDLVLLSIGGAAQGLSENIPHISLGQLQNDRLLAAVYSSADVLVIPSLQDNLPNTVLEAMACGVPSVGFDVGGIPDMIVSGVTGFLAAPGDVNALAKAIRSALDDQYRGKLRDNCRHRAIEQFDELQQARRYKQLYEKLSADRGAARSDAANKSILEGADL